MAEFCVVPNCANLQEKGSDFCKVHLEPDARLCSKAGCIEPTEKGSAFCPEHMPHCIVHGCASPVTPGRAYCSSHKPCIVTGCSRITEKDKPFCIGHAALLAANPLGPTLLTRIQIREVTFQINEHVIALSFREVRKLQQMLNDIFGLPDVFEQKMAESESGIDLMPPWTAEEEHH